MLLIGGTAITTYAQRGWDRGYRDHGRGHGRWEREGRWRGDDDDDRCERRRYYRDDCERPDRYYYGRRAYYAPVPAVIPVPVPAPVYYPSRPRAVFHAGVTIVN